MEFKRTALCYAQRVHVRVHVLLVFFFLSNMSEIALEENGYVLRKFKFYFLLILELSSHDKKHINYA